MTLVKGPTRERLKLDHRVLLFQSSAHGEIGLVRRRVGGFLGGIVGGWVLKVY